MLEPYHLTQLIQERIILDLDGLIEQARKQECQPGQPDPQMDALRLQIEAVTAETRALQNRASDPEDQDIVYYVGPNVLALESAMDECARAAGADPVQFRLDHIDDPRLAGVLRMAVKAAESKEAPAAVPHALEQRRQLQRRLLEVQRELLRMQSKLQGLQPEHEGLQRQLQAQRRG